MIAPSAIAELMSFAKERRESLTAQAQTSI